MEDKVSNNQTFSITVDGGFVLHQLVEAIIGIASIIGNGLVLFIVLQHKPFRQATNCLIASLSLADFLIGLVGIPCVIINNTGVPRHFYGCLFMHCVIIMLTTVSIFNMALITLERFIAIRHPLGHHTRMTFPLAAGSCVLAWVAGCIVGVIPMFGWHQGQEHFHLCQFLLVVDMEYMVYVNFLSVFFCPMLFVYGAYFYIFCVIKARPQVSSMSQDNDRDKEKLQREFKVAWKTFMVVIAFTLCWLPLHIANCVILHAGKADKTTVVTAVILSHCHSIINPIIYTHGHSSFRTALKKTLRSQSANKVSSSSASV